MKISIKGKHKIDTVKPFGNGAHVYLPKKCIGDKVTAILLKNENIEFVKDMIVVEGIEAVQREITIVGNVAHALLPSKWLGSDVLVVKE